MKKIYLFLFVELFLLIIFSWVNSYIFASDVPLPTCRLSYTPSWVLVWWNITWTLTSTNAVITKMWCAPKWQAITLSTKCWSSNCGSNGSWSVPTLVAQETDCKVEVTNSAWQTATCSASYIVEWPEPALPPPPVPLPTCKLSYTPSWVLLWWNITWTLTSTNAVSAKAWCAPTWQAITLSTKCWSSNCGLSGSWSVPTLVAQETTCKFEVTNSAWKTATCSASYIVEWPEPVPPPVVPLPTCKLSYTPSWVLLWWNITWTLTSTNAVITKMWCASKWQPITLSTRCWSSNCGSNWSWSVNTSVAQETTCKVEVTNSAWQIATCSASYVVEWPEPVAPPQPIVQPVVPLPTCKLSYTPSWVKVWWKITGTLTSTNAVSVKAWCSAHWQQITLSSICGNWPCQANGSWVVDTSVALVNDCKVEITNKVWQTATCSASYIVEWSEPVTPPPVVVPQPWLEPECNTQYVPVCWVKYLQSCQAGANSSCSKVPVYKTFWNNCELNNNKSKFVFYRNWSCESKDDSSTKLTDDSSIQLTDKIEVQLDQSIKNLISKVNQNYINKTDKINYINTIINKLQTVENNQPKYKNVTQYLINKLKEEISKIGVDANPNGIDEILNIFN